MAPTGYERLRAGLGPSQASLQITDNEGAAIEGIEVYVYEAGTKTEAELIHPSKDKKLTQPLKSDKDGWVKFRVAPDTYQAVATGKGFAPQSYDLIGPSPKFICPKCDQAYPEEEFAGDYLCKACRFGYVISEG